MSLDEHIIPKKKRIYKFQTALFIVFLVFLSIGMLFKILHWPGGNMNYLIGFGGTLAVFTSYALRQIQPLFKSKTLFFTWVTIIAALIAVYLLDLNISIINRPMIGLGFVFFLPLFILNEVWIMLRFKDYLIKRKNLENKKGA